MRGRREGKMLIILYLKTCLFLQPYSYKNEERDLHHAALNPHSSHYAYLRL